MSFLRHLLPVLVIASGLALVSCGGGGEAGVDPLSSNVGGAGAGSDDSSIQSGREGVPRAGAPDGSQAHVAIERRFGNDAGDRFQVDVESLPIGMIVDIWLESPYSPETFENIGTLVVDEGHGGEFVRSTSDGDALPYQVGTVVKLVGLGIELRSPAGLVLFVGAVPGFDVH